MLIGVRKRFVFVANSKTASTSIVNALSSHAEIMRGGTPQHKHIYMRDALRKYKFLFGQPEYAPNTFFRFGVMRDPIDWIQSWYRYRRGNKVAKQLPEDMSFADFWAAKDWNIQFPDGTKRLQSTFFLNAKGQPLVDYIIPYADIEAQFATICAALGVKAPLPRKNVSKIKKTDADLPEDLRAEMVDFYADDYALLGKLDQINTTGAQKLQEMSPAQ